MTYFTFMITPQLFMRQNHPFSSPNCGGGSPCAKQHTIAAGRRDGRARRPLPLLEPWLQIADE